MGCDKWEKWESSKKSSRALIVGSTGSLHSRPLTYGLARSCLSLLRLVTEAETSVGDKGGVGTRGRGAHWRQAARRWLTPQHNAGSQSATRMVSRRLTRRVAGGIARCIASGIVSSSTYSTTSTTYCSGSTCSGSTCSGSSGSTSSASVLPQQGVFVVAHRIRMHHRVREFRPLLRRGEELFDAPPDQGLGEELVHRGPLGGAPMKASADERAELR